MELPPDVVRLLVVDSVPVPLGVLADLAPRRDRIDTPVDEHAELGVQEPLWRRPLVEGGPVGFVALLGGRCRAPHKARPTVLLRVSSLRFSWLDSFRVEPRSDSWLIFRTGLDNHHFVNRDLRDGEPEDTVTILEGQRLCRPVRV